MRIDLVGHERAGYADLVFALVFVWGFGDAASTLIAYTLTGSVAQEANPLIRTLLAQDPMLLVVVKGLVGLTVGLALLACRDVVQRVPGWRTWLLVVLGVGTALVANNLYVGVAAAA
jgi:hypothetical protein